MAVQSDIVRDGLQQVIDTNKRIAELSVRVADEAPGPSRLRATPIRVAAPAWVAPTLFALNAYEARPAEMCSVLWSARARHSPSQEHGSTQTVGQLCTSEPQVPRWCRGHSDAAFDVAFYTDDFSRACFQTLAQDR